MSCLHNEYVETQYDKISEEFDTTRIRIWTSVQEFLLKHSENDNKTLLDVGVGNGKNIVFAKQHNYDCIGIDISNKLLEICRNKSLKVVKKDVLNLNKTFGTFDTIICIAMIHHLEDIAIQKRAIENMIDCLNNGGNLLISVWSKEIFNKSEKRDYRDFDVGPNIVKWNSKDGQNQIDRFYYIHDYASFNKMFEDIATRVSFSYEITWEKQNWFCEIKKH